MSQKGGLTDAISQRLAARTERALYGFNVSARQELQWWALVLIGAAFIYAGWTLDPQENCGPGGECAPWLVPVAFAMGVIVLPIGLGHLLSNPQRGSRVDFAGRRLYWWQGKESLDTHSLSLDDVALIKVRAGDDNDAVFLYDRDYTLLPFPGIEVIPWIYQDWAAALTRHFPHIRLEIED